MKKFMTVLAIAFCVSLIAPSCTQDEGFEDIVENSNLDRTTSTDQGKDIVEKPGGN